MAQVVATTRSTVRVMVIVCADASEAAASAAHHPWMRIGFVRWVWTWVGSGMCRCPGERAGRLGSMTAAWNVGCCQQLIVVEQR